MTAKVFLCETDAYELRHWWGERDGKICKKPSAPVPVKVCPAHADESKLPATGWKFVKYVDGGSIVVLKNRNTKETRRCTLEVARMYVVLPGQLKSEAIVLKGQRTE